MLSIYLYMVENHPGKVKHGRKKTNTNELEQLRQFKKKSRWSYDKIGERMGIHPQTIVFWIIGKHIPSEMAKEKIRRFLHEYFTETELKDKKENIEFESTLKDVEFHPGYAYITRPKKHCFLCWWTLKFENGAVVRVIPRDDQDATIFEPKDIWWIGKKYVVIKMPNYREIRLLEKDSEKKEENSIS